MRILSVFYKYYNVPGATNKKSQSILVVYLLAI